LVPVRIAAFASVFPQALGTRPDRSELSAVRASLLPDEPTQEIFTAMQGDNAS
jgi:hypothetical protein